MNNLTQLIYTSTSMTHLTIAELESILLLSRKNNAYAAITGMLLFQHGSFIQVLEGPKDAVQKTYLRIAKDKRHKNVSILYDNAITQRDFPRWAMAFKGIDSDEFEGLSDFLHPLKSKDDWSISEGAAKQLLKRFRQINKR